MNIEKFRMCHSTIIEHYQYIEAHLEGIYAALLGKSFIEGLQEVEKDSLPRIIKGIQKLESEKNISVFTEEEYKRMEEIVHRRNFWCHNCYYDLVFDAKTGGLKKEKDIQSLLSDLRAAEELREELFSRKMRLFKLFEKH